MREFKLICFQGPTDITFTFDKWMSASEGKEVKDEPLSPSLGPLMESSSSFHLLRKGEGEEDEKRTNDETRTKLRKMSRQTSLTNGPKRSGQATASPLHNLRRYFHLPKSYLQSSSHSEYNMLCIKFEGERHRITVA